MHTCSLTKNAVWQSVWRGHWHRWWYNSRCSGLICTKTIERAEVHLVERLSYTTSSSKAHYEYLTKIKIKALTWASMFLNKMQISAMYKHYTQYTQACIPIFTLQINKKYLMPRIPGINWTAAFQGKMQAQCRSHVCLCAQRAYRQQITSWMQSSWGKLYLPPASGGQISKMNELLGTLAPLSFTWRLNIGRSIRCWPSQCIASWQVGMEVGMTFVLLLSTDCFLIWQT